jgi:hypothetical protein
MRPADIATGAIALWALAALAWQQPRPPAPQRQALSALPVLTSSTSQLPDRRTLTFYPGP